MIVSASTSTRILRSSLLSGPLAVPTNGSGSTVPLALYPPGSDFSGFIILDPLTGESVNGSVYSMARAIAPSDPLFDSPQTMDGGGSGNSMPELETGFYRVVRDGVHIYGLTNGAVLSGTMQFLIEFAVGSTDQIVGVSFYDENSSPIIGASAQGAGNFWTLDWNTQMLPNGNCSIYAELDFASDAPVISAPVAVTVNNAISFPNYFSRNYGSQMWIYAETAPNASYRIDMYGQNTNYLGHFSGTVDSSGTISFLWGLNGLSDTNFFGVFSVTSSAQYSQQNAMKRNAYTNASPAFQGLITNSYIPAGGGMASTAIQIWLKQLSWSPGNGWAIAYSPLVASDSPTTCSIICEASSKRQGDEQRFQKKL